MIPIVVHRASATPVNTADANVAFLEHRGTAILLHTVHGGDRTASQTEDGAIAMKFQPLRAVVDIIMTHPAVYLLERAVRIIMILTGIGIEMNQLETALELLVSAHKINFTTFVCRNRIHLSNFLNT